MIKSISIFLIFFVCSLVEIFWAVGNLSDQPSAGCSDCIFIVSVAIQACVVAFVLCIVYWAATYLKRKYLSMVIVFVVFSISCLCIHYRIFEDRVAAWSTFSQQEIIQAVMWQSAMPVLVTGTVVALFTGLLKRYI